MNAIHLGIFHMWCAVLMYLSSVHVDCNQQFEDKIDAGNQYSTFEMNKRIYTDELVFITIIESVMIGLLYIDGATRIQYSHKTYIKAALIALLATMRVRRSGYFNICLDDDARCCTAACSRNQGEEKVTHTLCHNFKQSTGTCGKDNGGRVAWRNAMNFCPVPQYHYTCKEHFKEEVTDLFKFPDNSHCLAWGCDTKLTPLRAWMRWITPLTVMFAIYKL